MALTIDYSTPGEYVIQIPRADLTLISSSPTEVRQLSIDELRYWLMDIQDGEGHIWAPTTHEHTYPFTVSGVTLARVVEILEPYFIEFEDGLYNVNVVGGNSNVSDRTLKNQVGVNTANSAGLQDPFALQAAAFGGKVALDQACSRTGTEFPKGTRSFPVNNVADVIAIAEERGLRTVQLLSHTTLGSGDFSDGYNFEGDNPSIMLTLNAATDVTNCELHNLTVTGDLDGSNTLRECAIMDINFFNGFIFQCGFMGTVTLLGANPAVIMQSFSLVADNGDPAVYPKVDLQGTQITPLIIRDWQGAIEIRNCSDQQAACSIDMSSGPVHFDSTITDGTYTVRGVSVVDDDSGPGATVEDHTLQAGIPYSVWKHDLTTHDTKDTAGWALRTALGRLGNLMRVDNMTYDALHQMETCRFRVFKSEADYLASTEGGTVGGGDPSPLHEWIHETAWGATVGEADTMVEGPSAP